MSRALVKAKESGDREYMMDSIDLELKLLRGPISRLTPDEETAIRTYYHEPTSKHWEAAAQVPVAVVTSHDDLRPLPLGIAVLRYTPDLAPSVHRECVKGQEVDVWKALPSPDVVRETLRRLARTDRFPSIELELDMARTADNRLTTEERLAIQRSYYGGLVADFHAARDIVLLVDGALDGGDYTLLHAIGDVDETWLPNAMVERRIGGRVTRTLSQAPPAELIRAALIRATH